MELSLQRRGGGGGEAAPLSLSTSPAKTGPILGLPQATRLASDGGHAPRAAAATGALSTLARLRRRPPGWCCGALSAASVAKGGRDTAQRQRAGGGAWLAMWPSVATWAERKMRETARRTQTLTGWSAAAHCAQAPAGRTRSPSRAPTDVACTARETQAEQLCSWAGTPCLVAALGVHGAAVAQAQSRTRGASPSSWPGGTAVCCSPRRGGVARTQRGPWSWPAWGVRVGPTARY